jgi:hypothetical protein
MNCSESPAASVTGEVNDGVLVTLPHHRLDGPAFAEREVFSLRSCAGSGVGPEVVVGL